MSYSDEGMFYEVMWRSQSRGRLLPQPWWMQQCFRHWSDGYNTGLFNSREQAFASNALYRYWNMIGVKDAPQECLVGQAGEVEPIYDEYTLSFFLFDPATRAVEFPQFPHSNLGAAGLSQRLEGGFLPIVTTQFSSALGVQVDEKAFATTVGVDQRTIAVVRFNLSLTRPTPATFCLGLCVSSAGPTGLRRSDRSGHTIGDRRLTYLRYLPAEARVLVNTSNGPIFDRPPASFGTYGNGSSEDPEFYLQQNPFAHLTSLGTLNGWEMATDLHAGLCSGAFLWPITLTPAAPTFALDVRLPIDDFRSPSDLVTVRSDPVDTLETTNRLWWQNKLNVDGLQSSLPDPVAQLWDLFRICRANLLILADDGQIHPGPTIYDDFWVRDSSVEAIACSLVGDTNLAQRQLGYWHPSAFNFGYGQVDGVSLHGFFGRTHEIEDREWDSNGEALWAFGKFDRVLGPGSNFGRGIYLPYVIEGARWIRDNRSPFGLLHSGWSAEHIGDKGKPHYWDDFWALAGLWEAGQLALRIGAPEAGEIWNAYDSLRDATTASVHWVLDEQRRQGHWETFIPTGPGDTGRLDSTLIGTVCYFHPCRLYDGAKLGTEVDWAARQTLETIWGHFIDGGFRHDSAWNCYGPYLTLQLAHAFLLIGQVNRMDALLGWTVGNAGYPSVSRDGSPHPWQVALGAWNEQHCYPIAKDFAEVPAWPWYMGDIPHGWACAEFMLLIRDILFFESSEDSDPHIFIAAGVMPHWLVSGENLVVRNAPTLFGTLFGYILVHRADLRRISISITQPPPANVRFIFPCRFGSGIAQAMADGVAIGFANRDVQIPAGTREVRVDYLP